MCDDQHVKRLRAAYDRFLGGDPAPLIELLSDQVVYHLPGQHLGGGTVQGRAALFERMSRASAMCTEPPSAELLGAANAGDLVVTLERIHAKAADRLLDQYACVVWRFSQGQCVEIWSHFEDQLACDAFWSGMVEG